MENDIKFKSDEDIYENIMNYLFTSQLSAFSHTLTLVTDASMMLRFPP